jgi:hypothetical protein
MASNKDYLEPSEMPDNSFERRCWRLSTGNARNITKELDRAILIGEIERTIHAYNRFQQGKMTKQRLKERTYVRSHSIEELKEILKKLLTYKFERDKFSEDSKE